MHRVNYIKHLLVRLGIDANVAQKENNIIVKINAPDYCKHQTRLKAWFQINEMRGECIILTEKLRGGVEG